MAWPFRSVFTSRLAGGPGFGLRNWKSIQLGVPHSSRFLRRVGTPALDSLGHFVPIPAFTPSPFVDILAHVRKDKTRAVAMLSSLPPTLGFAKSGAPPARKTAELCSAGQVRTPAPTRATPLAARGESLDA